MPYSYTILALFLPYYYTILALLLPYSYPNQRYAISTLTTPTLTNLIYSNLSHNVHVHFIFYQTRGASPSNFDIQYAYNLGYTATKLVLGGFSGYMATIGNLKAPLRYSLNLNPNPHLSLT